MLDRCGIGLAHQLEAVGLARAGKVAASMMSGLEVKLSLKGHRIKIVEAMAMGETVRMCYAQADFAFKQWKTNWLM